MDFFLELRETVLSQKTGNLGFLDFPGMTNARNRNLPISPWCLKNSQKRGSCSREQKYQLRHLEFIAIVNKCEIGPPDIPLIKISHEYPRKNLVSNFPWIRLIGSLQTRRKYQFFLSVKKKKIFLVHYTKNKISVKKTKRFRKNFKKDCFYFHGKKYVAC